MTTHAKCPECGEEAELIGSRHRFVECRMSCWRGPITDTEAEAWRAWDTVVGAYWLYRDTISAAGELVDAMEKNDGEEEG